MLESFCETVSNVRPCLNTDTKEITFYWSPPLFILDHVNNIAAASFVKHKFSLFIGFIKINLRHDAAEIIAIALLNQKQV